MIQNLLSERIVAEVIPDTSQHVEGRFLVSLELAGMTVVRSIIAVNLQNR
ncbi:hypothetical protein [uncultured Vibrio sp.]|nr:hypothetical protein [uncultured Vibrio sp.]